MPLTSGFDPEKGLVHTKDAADEEAGPYKKQKASEAEDGTATASPDQGSKKQGSRFKIATRVVMAMKRFQASLNPTYSYGKRSSDGAEEHTDGHRVLVQPKAATAVAHDRRTSSGRTISGRTLSGRPTSAGQQHGYKANLLFRPLPHPDTAVRGS